MSFIPKAPDFDEVKEVLRQVIPKIKDHINITDLLLHMIEFSQGEKQEITAQIAQRGMPYSAPLFFGAVNRKPSSFVLMMAALKKTEQTNIYDLFYHEIRTFFSEKQKLKRLEEVLALIRTEEIRIGAETVPEQQPQPIDGQEHNDQPGSMGASGPPNAEDQSGPNMPQTKPESENNNPKTKPPLLDMLKCQDSNQQATNSIGQDSLASQRTPVRANQNILTASSPVDNNLADVSISDLQVKAYSKLAKELERPCSHGSNDPWWNYFLENADLENADTIVSRKEQRILEDSKTPGRDLLDLLADKECTLGTLDKLFGDLQMTEAVNVLRVNQTKVVHPTPSLPASSYKQDLENFDENNLNDAKERSEKETTKKSEYFNSESKTMSTTPTRKEGKIGNTEIQSIQATSSSSSLAHEDTPDVCPTLPDQGNIPHTVRTSYGSETEDTSDMQEIEDPPIKGTRAVAAVGDPSSENSRLNSEQESEKLREVRVNNDSSDMRNYQDSSKPTPALGQMSDENKVSIMPSPPIMHQGPSTGGETIDEESSKTPLQGLEHVDGPMLDPSTTHTYGDIHRKESEVESADFDGVRVNLDESQGQSLGESDTGNEIRNSDND